jgi:hypothetical protein
MDSGEQSREHRHRPSRHVCEGRVVGATARMMGLFYRKRVIVSFYVVCKGAPGIEPDAHIQLT